MPRAAHDERMLTKVFLERVQPQARPFLVWDKKQRGLALQVRPNGRKAWKVIYTFAGRTRWYHLAHANEFVLRGHAS